jgi:hypothetical protein
MAKTESLFRDVNERIATAAGQFGSDDAEFVCECADPTCVEREKVNRRVVAVVRKLDPRKREPNLEPG